MDGKQANEGERMIAGRNSMMGGSLPYDAEVEYLESTGTQFIKTGILMDSDIDVDIDFSFRDKSSGGVFVLGVRKVVNYYGYGKHIAITNDPKVGVVFGGAFVYSINDVSPDTRINLKTRGRKLFLNDVEQGEASGKVRDLNSEAFVFRANGSDSASCKIRIYGASFENRRKFTPVRVGSIGYMYDKVTEKLFGNQGTGAFVVGPDKQL